MRKNFSAFPRRRPRRRAPPGVNLLGARLIGTGFNYATLFENVSGSLVMGRLVGYFAFRGGVSQHWRLFLTTGILGGYTTFSAFSLDTILLYERGELGGTNRGLSPRFRPGGGLPDLR